MAVAKLVLAVLAVTSVDLVFGHPDADRHANVAIIGGHQISIEQAPFMASLRLNGTYHWCGGSIIHEQFILTAAHCIKPNRKFKILVGTDNINGKGQLYNIEKIVFHKKYNNKTFDYDICLIKLEKPLTFGPKVGKINLPNSPMKLPKRAIFNVTGWGATKSNEDSVSPKLLQVEIPLIRRRECNNIYIWQKHVITSHMICAGNLGHDSCQGDSGGPLTLGNVQVGVTSFGVCCGVMPGVYTKVASVVSWILRTIH